TRADPPEAPGPAPPEEGPPPPLALDAARGPITLHHRLQRAQVAVAPIGVQPGGIAHLRFDRLTEADHGERLVQRLLVADGEPDIARDHDGRSHTAANLRCGCLLTGSQSVIVSSFAAEGASSSP